MERYAEFFLRSRRAVVLFVLVTSAIAAWGLSRTEFDDVPRSIFASDDEGYAQLLELYDEFGTDDGDALLLLEAEDWFRPERLELLRRAVSEAAGLPGVEDVVWFGDLPVFADGPLPRPLLLADDVDLEAARTRALEHPLVRGRLLSEDGRAVLVLVRLEDDRIAIEDFEPMVDGLRVLAAELDGRAGVRAAVTGIPPIRVDIYRIIQRDQVRFFLIGGVLCALVALLIFRSIGAVVCTTVPPLVGAFWAYGFIGLFGAELDILSGILSMLVIVIALTDSVHLMIDVRISRSKGLGRREAAAEAIRHLGLPCALTSLTTAIGFGSLGLASVEAIGRFGLLAAGSVIAAFLAVITVMPLLASTFRHVGASRAPGITPASQAWIRYAGAVVRFVTAHPRSVSLAGVLATVGLIVLALRLVPENRLTEALPHGEAYQALRRCEEAFGGVLPSYVLVEWEEPLDVDSQGVVGVVREVTELLDGIEELAAPLSYLDLVEVLPEPLAARPSAALAVLPAEVTGRLVRPDLRRALVVAQGPDEGSHVMLPLARRIEDGLDAIETRSSGVELTLTGTDVVARANINRMIDDLAKSLAFAAIVIFGVIAFEFRSLRLGLVSLVPNLFPLGLVGGALFLSGHPLQLASAVLFTVLLGLAVDDTIHFLARYRREGTGPPRERVERAFLAVGRAIVVTTIVLSVGFATVALSEIPTNRAFALLSCLGLSGALIGDLVFLPALILVVRPGPADRPG
jgi:predicted RND superfamily exporter protein